MAYLAFYRTFRPMTFDAVVRQEHIVRILKNRISAGNIGHAYLFCGPRGTGKTTLAKIFARAINCETPENGSPCGKCETCKALADGANLDIMEIDAASNNGVDEMRDLREKVQYPPVAGKYKVYIIDEVHMLSPSAFNAVLKTLEEPPAHAVFILATTEPQKIPATILSRCMRFDFKLIPQKDLEGLVKSVFDRIGIKYEEEAVSAIARAGAGSARDSLSIADMCTSYTDKKLTYADVNSVLGSADFFSIAELAGNILNENASGALSGVESILSTGKSIGVLVRDLLNIMNNCSVVKICRNAKEIVNLPAENFKKIEEICADCDGHKILRVTEILAKAENDMKFSLNGKITLETAVLKCAMPSSDYNLDAILGKINSLEKKLSSGGQSNAVLPNTIDTGAIERRIEDKLSAKIDSLEKKLSAKPVENVAVQPERKIAKIIEESGASPFDKPKAEAVQPVMWDQPSSIKTSSTLTADDKKTVFGKFVRSLRTTRRNAVLFTLCMDLEHAFEGDKLILMTDSEAVYKGLTKADNASFVADTLAELGVTEYEVRMNKAQESRYTQAVNELKKNFNGINIDIK